MWQLVINSWREVMTSWDFVYSIDKSNKITEQDADALYTNCIESVIQINRNDQTSVNNLKTNIKLQSKRKMCLSSCLYDVHCLVNIVAVSW